MVKKVCRKCRALFEGSQCPICKGEQFGEGWKGRIIVIDVNKSDIAKKAGYTTKGEYAIKVK